jgi:hypothetical protein
LPLLLRHAPKKVVIDKFILGILEKEVIHLTGKNLLLYATLLLLVGNAQEEPAISLLRRKIQLTLTIIMSLPFKAFRL